MVVDLKRCSDLLDSPSAQDDDAVGQGHGLHLIVGDVDHCAADLPVEGGKLLARGDAQLRIQVRQRLVEQEDLGIADDRAADRDTLALTARESLRLAVEIVGEPQHLGGAADALIDLAPAETHVLESEGHVLVDAHVRVKRIGLEHHGKPAVGGRNVRDTLPVDPDLAAADLLQAGDDAQKRGFPAAGGTDEHHELAICNREIDTMNDRHGAVGLLDVDELQLSHDSTTRIISSRYWRYRW